MPLVEPKMNEERPKVTTEEKPKVNKSPLDSYTQQLAYTFTNPTNNSNTFKIKPTYNHKFPLMPVQK